MDENFLQNPVDHTTHKFAVLAEVIAPREIVASNVAKRPPYFAASARRYRPGRARGLHALLICQAPHSVHGDDLATRRKHWHATP